MSAVAPLDCPACGAAIALTDGDVAACGHCGESVTIPDEHRALRARATSARGLRRGAEDKLQALKKGSVPPWVPWAYARFVIPLAVLGVPAALGFTQSEYHWFAREWVVLGGLAPFLVMLLPWLVLDARSSPWVYFDALGLKLQPAAATAQGLACGGCGAPLELEPHAHAATCDYCLQDSWVSRATDRYDPMAGTEVHESNLAKLVDAERFATFDLRLLYAVYIPIVAIAFGVFWFFLPGRAVLVAEGMYVEGPWQPLGELRGVRDIAVTSDGHLVAVGTDGEVLDWHEGAWRSLGRGYSGVAAAAERVLLVGPAGRVAWLVDGRLESATVGDARDLVDAFVFASGEATAVGDEGAIAHFDGQRWRVDEQGGEVPYASVWGRSPSDLYIVGEVGLVRHLEGETWTESLVEELPSLVAVAGTRDGSVYVAAHLPEGAEFRGIIWKLNGDSMHGVSRLGFSSLSAAGPELLATGLDGTVEAWGVEAPTFPSPTSGALRASALLPSAFQFVAPGGIWLVEGRHVVAGDEGVFVRRQDL